MWHFRCVGLSVLLCLIALAGSEDVFAQGPICSYPNGTNQPDIAFNWQSHFTALTRVGTHFMPSFGDGDSMSRPSWSSDAYIYPYGSTGWKETWYFSRDQISSTAPIYELFSPGATDHMDSSASSEGAYALDLGIPMGYAWLNDKGGELKPLTRYWKSAINDHRTWLNSTPPAGYALDVTYSSTSSTPRFGYQRYGNDFEQCQVIAWARANGVVMQNSSLRVLFNPIWGNAIGEVRHLASGKELVSHSLGDMMQPVFWYGPGREDGAYILNPTQSGGAECWDYGDTRLWAGSPVVSTTGPSGSTIKTFSTTTRPLNFCHSPFTGTDRYSPLLWRGLMRVTTTLGCKLGSTTYSDVIRVKQEGKKDTDAPFTESTADYTNGGWFLFQAFGDCRDANGVVELVNLTTGVVESSSALSCGSSVAWTNKSNRGVRIVSGDGNFAMGFARLGSTLQYDVTVYCGFNGCSDVPDQKLVVGSHVFKPLSKTAWNTDQAYFTYGSPSDVLQRLLAIKSDGGNCDN